MDTSTPRSDTKEKRTKIFNIRCTEAEKAIFHACARAAGFEETAPYIRKLILDDYHKNSHRAYKGVLAAMLGDDGDLTNG